MAKTPETKEPPSTRCERCGDSFQCGADNITACHCSRVTLTPEQRAFIARTWNHCLCPDCLVAVATTNGLEGNPPPISAVNATSYNHKIK